MAAVFLPPRDQVPGIYGPASNNSDIPNAHYERIIAGWGVQQVKSKNERKDAKACERETKNAAQVGERKVLVKST